MHRDYNTTKDTWDKLDYAQMVDIAEFVMAFAQNISERDKNNVEGKLYSQYEVDKPAEFIHGDERQFLNKWVYKYIKYPDSALKNGIQGRVIVNFVIEKDGSVSNISIAKGLSDDIDDEVTKVVSSTPKWRAAQYGGEKVRVKISLPIDFKVSNSGSRNRIRIKK
jgi:TonB family C-terminal domain